VRPRARAKVTINNLWDDVYEKSIGTRVGIDLKELWGVGGQLPKCLKFCPGIEI